MGRDNRKRSSKDPNAIDHARFLQMLTNAFADAVHAVDEYGKGLLHCEMGVFARLTEEAMDEARFWQVDNHFRFIERVLKSATPEVENAIAVSYIESLALGEVTDKRIQAIKQMPKALRTMLLEIDGRGRWA